MSRGISRSSLFVEAALQERYYASRAKGTNRDTYTLLLYLLAPKSSIHDILQDTSLKFRFPVPLSPAPASDLDQGIRTLNKCSELFRCRWLGNHHLQTLCKPVFWERRGAQPPNPTQVSGLGGAGSCGEGSPQCRRGGAPPPPAPRSPGPSCAPRQLPPLSPSATNPSRVGLSAFLGSHPGPGRHPVSPGDLDPPGLCPEGPRLSEGVLQVNK